MTDTPFALFHNRLRIMLNIDKDQLDAAIGAPTSMGEWTEFQSNPWRWFITTDSRTAEKVFVLIKEREKAWAEKKKARQLLGGPSGIIDNGVAEGV